MPRACIFHPGRQHSPPPMPAETPLAGTTPGHQPQALVEYDENRSTNMTMLDEKEDMSTLKMLLVKKRKLLIGGGVLLVAAIAGVVALVAGGKTADATTGSALPPVTPNTTTTETTLAPNLLSDVIVSNSVASAPTSEPTLGSALESANIGSTNSTNSTDTPITTPAATPNATATPEPTPEPTTTTPAPTTTTPAPTTTTPAPTTTTLRPTALAPKTIAPQINDNGSGLWGGSIKIVNNIEENCKSSNTVTYFPPGYSKYDLSVGASATIGPYSGWYTLGVQENVFAKCASAGECAWEGKSVDNYCYNFSVHEDCTITYNDCPHPHGDPSPAPDGRKRYSISGSVDSNGVCVLSVNPIVSGCTGECICFAKK
ncbi:hypothetical protein LEN26_014463 [Aphanomyces euteiches]|nr:hypothetical protein LEN26_014463 [Aphanomyces euteiches]